MLEILAPDATGAREYDSFAIPQSHINTKTVPAMNPKSSEALVYFSGFGTLAGFLINSPSGAMFAFCLAALSAIIPTAFGSGRTRFVAVGLLLLSLGLSAGKFPDFRREQENYRQRESQQIDSAPHGANLFVISKLASYPRAISTRGGGSGGRVRL